MMGKSQWPCSFILKVCSVNMFTAFTQNKMIMQHVNCIRMAFTIKDHVVTTSISVDSHQHVLLFNI